MSEGAARYGVLAFGDSITNGGGELQWGVALQSWALWLARALGLPFTGYAVDGARVEDVRDDQFGAFERRAVPPEGRYDVGCLYIGVNDVRGPDWDATTFAADYDRALARLSKHCDRTLALTAPLALGYPPAQAKVRELNAIVRDAAARHGALVVELESLRARNQVMVDRVHPTALGQIAIAERALAVLERDGLPTRIHPAALVQFAPTRADRLRSDLTYVYRQLRLRVTVAATRSLQRR